LVQIGSSGAVTFTVPYDDNFTRPAKISRYIFIEDVPFVYSLSTVVAPRALDLVVVDPERIMWPYGVLIGPLAPSKNLIDVGSMVVNYDNSSGRPAEVLDGNLRANPGQELAQP